MKKRLIQVIIALLLFIVAFTINVKNVMFIMQFIL